MHILNHLDFIETRLQSDEWYSGGGGDSYSGTSDKPEDKTLSGKKGTLKEDFGHYALERPDGSVVTVYQDGRITETPKDGKESTVKLPDKTFIC
tara:strand:- start:218923 stop:219204 length:282 start_codon:yes stop_codon:yes gene_type:complete